MPKLSKRAAGLDKVIAKIKRYDFYGPLCRTVCCFDLMLVSLCAKITFNVPIFTVSRWSMKRCVVNLYV